MVKTAFCIGEGSGMAQQISGALRQAPTGNAFYWQWLAMHAAATTRNHPQTLYSRYAAAPERLRRCCHSSISTTARPARQMSPMPAAVVTPGNWPNTSQPRVVAETIWR